MSGTEYTGILAPSFIIMGKLCLSADLSGVFDSGSINALMTELKGQKVKISIEAVP